MTDTYKLLDNATAAGVGKPAVPKLAHRTFHAMGKTTAGAGAASIDILGSNTGDIADAVLLGNIGLTLGTTTSGDGFVSSAPWVTVWARVNSISGTGAAVSVVAAA